MIAILVAAATGVSVSTAVRATACPFPADVEQLVRVGQAVHVEMDQLPLSQIFVYDGKSRAGHPAVKPHAPGHAPDKGGLARAQIPVHGNHRAFVD